MSWQLDKIGFGGDGGVKKTQKTSDIINGCSLKATNSWTPLTKMSTKRYYSASVPVKGKLLVLGGWDDDNRLATSEYVSPAWRCIPASMTSRLHHHLHIESSSLDTIISILCTSSNHCHPWNFDRSSVWLCYLQQSNAWQQRSCPCSGRMRTKPLLKF